MKCDRCGIQSDVEQAFSTEKRLLRKTKHFCPDCTVKRRTRSFFYDLALVAGIAFLVSILSPFSGAASLILEAYLIVLCMIPMVVVHELAHAGAAWLAGLRTFGIVIGVGKQIWSGKLLGMDWTINILPIAGITGIGAPPVPNVRWKLFFVYLAGPASHLLMVAAFSFLWLIVPAWMPGHRLFGPLLTANILLAIISLFPQKTSTVVGMQGSDGWELLRVLFLKDDEIAKYHIGYFASEAMQSYSAGDLASAKQWVDKALAVDNRSGIARNVLGIVQMANREHETSRETFRHILETEAGREPALHYTLLNNIAYLNVLLGDPSLLPEADQFSTEALKHMPWVPAIVSTRGTVLVELGQCDEGIALLKRAMSLTDKHSKALNACHIAIGEYRRGDHQAAHKYLASAKTLDPNCFLIPDVEAKISRMTVDNRT